jgi:uncharacterized protein YaaW (UPF0174 family)
MKNKMSHLKTINPEIHKVHKKNKKLQKQMGLKIDNKMDMHPRNKMATQMMSQNLSLKMLNNQRSHNHQPMNKELSKKTEQSNENKQLKQDTNLVSFDPELKGKLLSL